MYNHNKAQLSKNRVHISWDILYDCPHGANEVTLNGMGNYDRYMTAKKRR